MIEVEHADTHGGLYRIPDPGVYVVPGCEDLPKPPLLRGAGAGADPADDEDDEGTDVVAGPSDGVIGFGDENTRPPATLAARSLALPAALSDGRGRWYASTSP